MCAEEAAGELRVLPKPGLVAPLLAHQRPPGKFVLGESLCLLVWSCLFPVMPPAALPVSVSFT